MNNKNQFTHSCSCPSCHDEDNINFQKQKYIQLSLAIFSLLTGILYNTFFQSSFSEYILGAFSLISVLLCGYKIFISGFKSIFKLKIDETTLMAIAVIAAFALGEYFEAALVTLLFFIGEIFEEKAVASSKKEISKLAKIRPDVATVLINNTEVLTEAEDVKIGDVILVKPFERVPLDGIVIEGATTLDASALTGESLPINAENGFLLLSGMQNLEGIVKVKVTNNFEESTASRIIKLIEEAAARKSNNEKLISRFAAVYTPIMFILALLIATVPTHLGFGNINIWLYRSLVCLVASCPCSIVISVPLAYYAGIGAASKIGFLIKGGKYLEALATADLFAFDKTGTITTGQLSDVKIHSLSELSENQILSLAAACEKYSEHPIASAIKNAAVNVDLLLPKLENYSEKAGYGVYAEAENGTIACVGKKALQNIDLPSEFEDANVFVLINNKLAGVIFVSDSIRNESKSVVEKIKRLGAKTILMLTGDNDKIAKKTADEVGITNYESNLLPEDKLNIIEKNKSTHKSVVFIGDGINDSPCLATSSCGIAMGFGSDAAIEAADAVLTAGDLAALPEAVIICRKTLSTVKANIIFSLLIKFAVIALAVAGIAPIWLAVFSDTGVSLICILNSIKILKSKKNNSHKDN